MQVENKKIIFVVPSLKGGGAEKVASTLLESLQNSQNNIRLRLVLFGGATEERFNNIDTKHLDVSASRNVFSVVARYFRVIYRLAKIIRQESPCTILSFMDYANVVSIIGNRLSGTRNRLIASVHIPPSAQTRKYAADYREKIMGFLIKRFYNMADAVVAVSRGVKNDLTENFHVDESRVNVIHNPVDVHTIENLSIKKIAESIFYDNIPIVLTVGRIVKQKGFECLLQAFSILNGKVDARLVILGEGSEEQNLKKLSMDLSIDKKVYFFGFKDNPYKYMKQSTIFVLPSLYEGFGIVLVEAMVCGLPVITTRSYEGVEDIINHGENGLIVPVADEKALAEAMLKLLNEESLRRSLAEEGKKTVNRFAVERITNQYKAVIGISSKE